MPVNIEIIRQSTNRLPFSDADQAALEHFLKASASNNLVVRLHERMIHSPWSSIGNCIEDGIIILSCPQIESDIIYVKVADGKGFFGGEKSRFNNYLGDILVDEFEIGASHKMLVMGLTGINNIFRANGLLRGMAI